MSNAINIWDYAHLVTSKPNVSDPNTWNWTPAVAEAVRVGGEIEFTGNQTYIISSVQILANCRIRFQVGTVIQRLANFDGEGTSYWSNGSAVFELGAPGLNVEFLGQWTYDGNEASMVKKEPTGFFVKCMPKSSDSQDDTKLKISGGTFRNGTSGYLCLRGTDSVRQFNTLVSVVDCFFHATRYGTGRDDPNTQTALGYSPNYILCADYVQLSCHNFWADFEKPISTGKYSVTAILGTYVGRDPLTSGQCSITLTGRTNLRRMGRGGPGWNGSWTTALNGIGCIDVYGNGENLFVEDIRAIDCYSIPLRGKSSLKEFTAVKGRFENCVGGINISPSSTGPVRCTVSIGQIRTIDCNIPVIEVTGSTPTESVPMATIESVHCTNSKGQDNQANVGVNLTGVVRLRNIEVCTVEAVYSDKSDEYGMSCVSIQDLTIAKARIKNCGRVGVHVTGCTDVNITANVEACGGEGINISSCTGKVHVSRCVTKNTVNYGIFANTAPAQEIVLVDNTVSEVSGSSRGLYAAGALNRIHGNIVGAGVTTPYLSVGTSRNLSSENSWEPADFWGTGVAPTVGTYKRGDRIKNSTPTGVAGSVRELTCTAAGTPGTWAPTNF